MRPGIEMRYPDAFGRSNRHKAKRCGPEIRSGTIAHLPHPFKELTIQRRHHLIGFDGSDMTLICTPRLTTIAQPAYQIGMKAAEMLLAVLEGDALKERNVTLDFELKVRQSTR